MSHVSSESVNSASGRRAMYSHPLYSLSHEKSDQTITSYNHGESYFSSCSTSPNTSCESLNTGAMPLLRLREGSNVSDVSDVSPAALAAALARSGFNRASQSSQSSQSSSLSARFADDYYPLITNVATAGKSVHCSLLDMAHAYNTYIRAINSCYNHASAVPDGNIHDFLFFNRTLLKILSQYLKVDRQHLQPLLQKVSARRRTVAPKTVNIHEDVTFQAFFSAWSNYINDRSSSSAYSVEQLQTYISTFAPILVQHFHDSVSHLNTLVNENVLMPNNLTKIWSECAEMLSQGLDLYTEAPLLLGCHDRNFTINGQRAEQKFPQLPNGTRTMVKKWHSRRHSNAWMFCSSNFGGIRRSISD